jgi:hypothetical protein
MDAETERTRKLGCWDGHAYNQASIDEFTTNKPTPDFELPLSFRDSLITVGLGEDCPKEFRERWRAIMAVSKEKWIVLSFAVT